MSGSSTPTPDRSELLFLGHECHHPSCHLHDFLPFTCPACRLSFCQPHFLPTTHACTAPLPLSMVDRIAPQCPLCNQVVPKRGGDDNEAVERHLMDGACIGLPGGEERKKLELRRKKDRGEVCWKKGCSKGLIVKMKCQGCGHDFCPPHRHQDNHSCGNTLTGTSSKSTLVPQVNAGQSGPKTGLSRLIPSTKTSSSSSTTTPKPLPTQPVSSPATPVGAQLDAKAAAAAAALKRAGQDVKAPFVQRKVDKRAEAEQASALKALKARHEKGLLSRTEEVRYARLVGAVQG